MLHEFKTVNMVSVVNTNQMVKDVKIVARKTLLPVGLIDNRFFVQLKSLKQD
jgi:hypothetical protein